MLKRINPLIYLLFSLLLLAEAGCKKGTFDINDVNPNVPSDVSPKFILSAALARSAYIMRQGDADFAQLYMGYWAVSGDYIPVTSTLTYQTTTGYFSDNWDAGYQLLKNYRQMEELGASDPNQAYFVAIGKIMEAFHFERLVDMYNNLPYSEALQGGVIDYPKYDDAASVYTGLLGQLDTAILLISNAPATAANPGSYDVMFGGDMASWTTFANTIKLRTVMNLTQTSGGAATITAALTGLSSADFLGVGQDAAVNPGYSNSSNAQQSPFYQDMGFQTNGSPAGNESYYRACSYAVNYMYATSDTLRLYQIYAPGSATGVVAGRPFGSEVSALQDNQHISGMGPGLLQTPSSSAVIFPACESFFLQAEATQDGYLPGGATAAAALYTTAVEESFRLLQVPNSQAAADNFLSTSNNPDVNIALSSNPVQTIIMGEWVALNGFDPVQSWDNWKRLGIPANLPVSIFGGTTAPHVPYRLLYSQTEFQFNSANVAAENVNGYPDNINDKIFWMP
jgi:SusD/RagB-like outer membrane lipoprotein